MLKTRIKIVFKDGEKLELEDVQLVVYDMTEFSEKNSDKIMVRFTDFERGEGTAFIDKNSVLELNVELYKVFDEVGGNKLYA